MSKETEITYEIYAPEYGALHGMLKVNSSDKFSEALEMFERAKQQYLYVDLKEVTTIKETIRSERP